MLSSQFAVSDKGIKQFNEIENVNLVDNLKDIFKLKNGPFGAKASPADRYRQLFFNIVIQLVAAREM